MVTTKVALYHFYWSNSSTESFSNCVTISYSKSLTADIVEVICICNWRKLCVYACISKITRKDGIYLLPPLIRSLINDRLSSVGIIFFAAFDK